VIIKEVLYSWLLVNLGSKIEAFISLAVP
jgi:hypothetical protein